MKILTYLATEESAGGISALGLNWKAFLFQLITFVIVLLILKKFAFGKILDTLENRRQAVEKSIEHAAETEQKLQKAEQNIQAMMTEARKEADAVIDNGHKEAAQLVEIAETKAIQRAEHIVTEAKNQMDVEVAKVREELKSETAKLVALATEKIIGEKLDAKSDEKLIAKALSEAKNG